MKEVLIRVRMEGNEIETLIRPKGFEPGVETSLTIIGILQNMIELEADKLRTIRQLHLKKKSETESQGEDGV